MNTARYGLGGAGIQTAGVVFGGGTPPPTTLSATEEWDGTNWSNSAPLATARVHIGGLGTKSAALAFGGTPNDSAGVTNTEEFTSGTFATQKITTS